MTTSSPAVASGSGTSDDLAEAARVRVDVVIVNYNTADLLIETMEQLPSGMPDSVDWKVFVADNDSADDSLERLRAGFPDVEVVEMGWNAGFCRGNNAAIRRGDAEFVLLVNTDTRLFPDTLTQLLQTMHDDPRAAVVAPRLEFADGRFQTAAAGAPFTLRSYLTWTTGLSRFADRWPALEGVYTTQDHGRAEQVGWVCSACMLLRRSAVEEVGLMDERIFLYMDDVDLCTRVRDAGWTVWHRGDVRAVHFMSGGALRKPGTISPYTVQSMTSWFDRRYGGWRSVALRGAGTVAHGLRGIRNGLQYAVHRDELSKDRSVMNFRLATYFVRPAVAGPLAGPAPDDIPTSGGTLHHGGDSQHDSQHDSTKETEEES
ncbi:MAG: glycosyltransferase family 2 protein [Actinobacteria bacterium]|nr:glycosyltransferase family 2 protein [Actinomycetota bacterium]